MVDLTDAEIDAALVRGRAAAANEPRATSAIYDRAQQKLVIEMANGISVAIPPRLIEGLSGATIQQLAGVRLQGQGYGLHWPAMDIDMSVPGLIAGVFGTKSYMAKLAGRTKSKAKSKAARKNGAKGGRPKKAAA